MYRKATPFVCIDLKVSSEEALTTPFTYKSFIFCIAHGWERNNAFSSRISGTAHPGRGRCSKLHWIV